jgi:hypothetical protein
VQVAAAWTVAESHPDCISTYNTNSPSSGTVGLRGEKGGEWLKKQVLNKYTVQIAAA